MGWPAGSPSVTVIRVTRHTIAQVLSAWQAAGQYIHTAPGLSADQLVEAGRLVGRPVPSDVAELYRATDGLVLGEEALRLYPMLGTDEELGVDEAGPTYRSWGWGIPEELLILGADETDRLYGVWAPEDARRTLVVAAEESLEGPALAVVGTGLAAFLAAWTAYHLPLTLGETPEVIAALDVLGVPAALREGESEFDDEHLHALLAWASPDLPDDEPDPAARPIDPAELTRLATG